MKRKLINFLKKSIIDTSVRVSELAGWAATTAQYVVIKLSSFGVLGPADEIDLIFNL